MDLKEVNNNVQNNFPVSKVDLRGLATASAFADLLSSASKNVGDFSSQVKENRVVSSREVEVKDKSTYPSYDRDVKSKNKLEKKENVNTYSEKEVKSSKNSEKEVKSSKNKETTEKNASDVENEETGSKKTASSVQDDMLFAFVYGPSSMEDMVLSEDAAFILPEMNGGGEDVVLFRASDIPDVANSADANVNVASAQTTLSVAAAAPQLPTAVVAETVEVNPTGADGQLTVPLEMLPAMDVQAADLKVVDTKAPAKLVGADVDEGLVKQAEKIAEVVGKDKSLKISIDVKEEKFAHKDFVANRFELNRAVDSALEQSSLQISSETEMLETAVANKEQRLSAKVETAALQTNTNPTAAIVQLQNADGDEIAIKAPVLKEEVSVASLSGSAASKLGSLKTDTVVMEDTKVQSKDVYKGMSKEAVEQVKVNITKSAVKGVDKINIHLKPEERGSMEVKLKIGKDGKLDAQIVTSRLDTLDVLQKEAQVLEKAFNDAGFKTDSDSLNFSFKNPEQENGREQLKNFIGETMEKEIAVANQEIYWSDASGVNIKV